MDKADSPREKDEAGKKDEAGIKGDMLKRLRRIEGQVKGIQKMSEEEKQCVDILTQIAAVRAAINKFGSLILEKHCSICIEKAASSEDKKKVLSELVKTMQSFINFTD